MTEKDEIWAWLKKMLTKQAFHSVLSLPEDARKKIEQKAAACMASEKEAE